MLILQCITSLKFYLSDNPTVNFLTVGRINASTTAGELSAYGFSPAQISQCFSHYVGG